VLRLKRQEDPHWKVTVLQFIMRAIAVRRVARLLAHTQEGLLILFGFEDLRLKSGRLVGAIAKGLSGGMAAGAPSVGFAGLEVGA